MASFFGNATGQSGVINTPALNTVKNFIPLPEYAADQMTTISGITKDNTGAVLTSCTVTLYDTVTNVVLQTTVSDATTGAYSFFANPFTTNYAVAYKAGGTPVSGTTVNTLVGT